MAPTEFKLLKSEIPLYAENSGLECRTRGRVVVTPVFSRGDGIRVEVLEGREAKRFVISPEEAFTIGQTLVEHAIECGCDPDDGESQGT